MFDGKPTIYTRDSFIKFLRDSNENSKVIEKFINLPEAIIYNGYKYVLTIDVTYYSKNETYYSFELNYYAGDILEFLLTYKVFQDIEQSIDRAECELIQKQFISPN